jgi:hypothetical protein
MAKKNERIWEYLDAICQTKDTSVLEDPDFDKVYDPFVINRALSAHDDSVLAAQMVNERSDMPRKAQFLFLLNTLRSRKRFGNWLKGSKSDDAIAVAEYYGCSLRHARDLVSLHSSDQLTIIHARLEKGGTTNKVRGNGIK